MKSKPLFAFYLLSLTLIASCNNQSEKYNTMDKEQLTDFGKKYSEAWCSQKPESVAAFFATNGSFKINADSPAVGREAITKVAQGFKTAFPGTDIQSLGIIQVVLNFF